MLKPREHQQEFMDIFDSTLYKGIIAFHGMGLGKTLTTLWIARTLLNRAKASGLHNPQFVVFCPKSAITTWRAEIAKNTPDIQANMIVLPYSQLKHAVKRFTSSIFPYVLIALDECHYLKSPETDRIQDFAKVLEAIAKSKHGDICRVLPMTGTPFPNNASEIFTMWTLCTSPNLLEASKRMLDETLFRTWRSAFTNEKQVTIKRKSQFIPNHYTFSQAVSYEGVANADELNKLLAPVIHYKRVEDCIDLPEKQREYIKLNLPDDDLLKGANIEKPDEYMSLLERISTAKTPYVIEWVDNFIKLGSSEQLVVFSMFTSALRTLQQRFPKQVRLITGRESQTERDTAIRAFQSGALKVIAMSYKAGSESLNLQNARNTLYINFPWNEDTLLQAEARTYRSGQKNATNHYFMMSGENDVMCYERVQRKAEANRTIKDRLLVTNVAGQYNENLFEGLTGMIPKVPELDTSFGGLL